MALEYFRKRAQSPASIVEYITALIILATVNTETLLDGYDVLLDTKKCPPALLRDFDSER